MFSEILIGVTIAVISAVIIYKLGLNGGSAKVTIHSSRSNSSKGWKLWIVVGWTLVAVGIYYAGTYGPDNGLQDWRTGLGISSLFFGACSIFLGRLGLWWNR